MQRCIWLFCINKDLAHRVGSTTEKHDKRPLHGQIGMAPNAVWGTECKRQDIQRDPLDKKQLAQRLRIIRANSMRSTKEKCWPKDEPHDLPATIKTNSPRGALDAKCSSNSWSVPVLVSSWILLISRTVAA